MLLRRVHSDLLERISLGLASSLRKSYDYTALASNRYSLPNVAPSGGFRTLQTWIRACLSQIVRNKDFKKVIIAASHMNKKDFIKRLYSSQVIPAKALCSL
ncbi:hypothetical protein B7P43_G04340 [Cryptotermes secundus]|uniref:Uncharacterized protein n=1 Tax=Cryptotermes secundus TaxID=105785 RepID=A0A2J7QW73_9NEOP|nr:hypothetical protein B7P43_G04340 [Cryptotermes secundus]